MIIVDVNVLIYAYNSGAEQHATCRSWVESAFGGTESIAVPWAVAHAFLRLTTDKYALQNPLAIAEACTIVDEWYSLPAVAAVVPGPRYWHILRDLLVRLHVRGSLVSDAHLAALAIENDASVCTTDRDFERFPGLRLINPLAS